MFLVAGAERLETRWAQSDGDRALHRVVIDAFNQGADQSASFANRQVIPQRLQIGDCLQDSDAVGRAAFNPRNLFIDVEAPLLVSSQLITE